MHVFILVSVLISLLFNVQSECIFGKKNLCTIKAPKTVRVLLHEIKQSKQPVTLYSDKGFSIQPVNKKKQILVRKNIDIFFNKRGIVLNGILYKSNVIIKSINKKTSFNKNTYRGIFFLKHNKKSIFLINVINLEKYVYCVLKTESWPGWPVEINKVLAIVCRTYVLAMIEKAQRKKKSYHVTNTNKFQTYYGTHETPSIAQAIKETRGIIITYNKKPILAMYDSCCGGIIPSRIKRSIDDYNKAPYLARKYACMYCKNCLAYSWQIDIPINVFAKKIGCSGKKINSVRVTKKNHAGLVKELSIKGKKLSTKLTGSEAYALSKKIKSFCFDTYKKAESIIFKGRGLGHHIGLCQWGAREMVKRGYSYQKILPYYYPGIILGKII